MASINYMNDQAVRKYYNQWELLPQLTGWEKTVFYKFVKACLGVDRKLDIDYLKGALYDSFHEKYHDSTYDNFKHEVIVLFETLRDFANTDLP